MRAEVLGSDGSFVLRWVCLFISVFGVDRGSSRCWNDQSWIAVLLAVFWLRLLHA